jgi:hypothetical protein
MTGAKRIYSLLVSTRDKCPWLTELEALLQVLWARCVLLR